MIGREHSCRWLNSCPTTKSSTKSHGRLLNPSAIGETKDAGVAYLRNDHVGGKLFVHSLFPVCSYGNHWILADFADCLDSTPLPRARFRISYQFLGQHKLSSPPHKAVKIINLDPRGEDPKFKGAQYKSADEAMDVGTLQETTAQYAHQQQRKSGSREMYPPRIHLQLPLTFLHEFVLTPSSRGFGVHGGEMIYLM